MKGVIMKRFICLLSTLVILFSMAIPVFAAVPEEIQPLYTNIDTVGASLTINETLGIATCTGRLFAKDIQPVKVIVRLQIYKDGYWQTLKSWTGEGSWTIVVSKQYAIYSGYTYRVTTAGYVYDDDGNILEAASASHTVNYPAN